MPQRITHPLFLLLPFLPLCSGILPTGEITVWYSSNMKYSTLSRWMERSLQTTSERTSMTLFASQASFGTYPEMSTRTGPASPLQNLAVANSWMCDEDDSQLNDDTVLMVGRGGCTFQKKAMNAEKAGAKGIIIYGTLASRYDVNSTTGEIVYPTDKFDYDCEYGRSYISKNDVSLPYSDENDALMKQVGNAMPKCASRAALLTGKMKEDDSDMMEACCAWDLHIWLYNDPNITTPVNIPALYITASQFDTVSSLLTETTEVQIQMSERYQPPYNASAFLVWALGVFVACLASYLSAGEYRAFIKHVSTSKAAPTNRTPSRENILPPSGEYEVGVQRQLSTASSQEENLELTLSHALFFIFFASASLFILFYFQIYNVVKVMYAFGGSGAIAQVLIFPLFQKWNSGGKCPMDLNATMCNIDKMEIGPVSYLDVLSSALAYVLGLAWLVLGFVVAHPEQNAFYWIWQDVMGACICITFLSVIRINNIRVATALLCIAFFYDIFFVFITPYIFDQSIMVTVATSGGPPTADPTWCEKYPSAKDCQGGDPLPMLLTVPRIGDYQGGSSLLGLGDIVLPGLLLSFCIRLDTAKSLIGVRVGGQPGNNCPKQNWCCPYNNLFMGYFLPTCVAYAIGLIMANMAVYLMQMGQPALLYLVPLCLGTVVGIAKYRGEFNDLWHGPKVLRAADDMVNGTERQVQHGEEDGGVMITAVEGVEGDENGHSLT